MGCNSKDNVESIENNKRNNNCNHGSDCVCNIVKKIAAAQNEAVNNTRNCDVSCERSIKDLLSPTQELGVNRNTTIPFILYCKKSCKPFFGNGVFQTRVAGHTHFHCVTSPIFRVNRVKKDCCAQLELLLPVDHNHKIVHPYKADSVCDFFPKKSTPNHKHVRALRASGICITVDLKDFKAISCLDPVTPIAAPITAEHKHYMMFGDTAAEEENY